MWEIKVNKNLILFLYNLRMYQNKKVFNINFKVKLKKGYFTIIICKYFNLIFYEKILFFFILKEKKCIKK